MKKKIASKILSVFLAVAMVIGSAPLNGFVGVKFPEIKLPEWNLFDFSVEADAATSGIYTFTVLNGEATITDCSSSASGSITIPSTLEGYTVTSIGSSAFYYCANLTSVTIPDSVTSIGSYAFEDCRNLTSVTIGNGVTSIGSYAFDYCISLTNVYYTGDIESWCEIKFGNAYSNPMCYAKKFYINNTLVKEIVISDTVTEIKNFAFYKFDDITSVTIPDSVISIGYSAFNSCTNLKNITIPDSVTSIDNYAFYGCTGIKELTMPASAKIYNSSYTFYNCSNIEKVTLTKGTGTMQYNDYRYTPWYTSRNSIKEIIIEDGVTNISFQAFSECAGLKSIVIPDSVTSIGDYAFNGCTGLTSITIPDSVTSIGQTAFYNCYSIRELTMPVSAGIDDYYTFYNCSNIEKVTLTKGTGTMQYNDYRYTPWYISRNSVKQIIIEDGVTNISSQAFRECTGLRSIVIPDGVTSIGDYAFYYCTGLEYVVIPDSVASIDYGAFLFYGKLECALYKGTEEKWSAISINSFNEENLSNAIYYNVDFQTENGFVYAVTDNEALLCAYTGSKAEIAIPDEFADKPVKAILANAFKDNQTIKSVTVPDSVVSIGANSFYNCTGLTSISLPDSITKIGSCVVDGCIGLKYILYSGTEDEWGEIGIDSNNSVLNSLMMFYNNNLSITESGFVYTIEESGAKIISYIGEASSLTIPEKIDGKDVVSVSGKAFYGCVNLTSVVIPDSVTNIGSYAFANCSNVKSMVIPDGVTEIGSCAFAGMTSLEELTVPFVGRYKTPKGDQKQRIFGWFFKGYNRSSAPESAICQYESSYYVDIPVKLKKVTITNADVISGYAFQNCWFIEDVSINDSAAGLGKCAFDGCINLKKINIPESSPLIGGYVFRNCEKLESVTFPESVATIGYYAFYGCKSLKSMVIPKGVTIVGDYVFYECNSLALIVIADTVTSVGKYAFYNCSALKELTLPASVTMSDGEYTFYNCTNIEKVTLSKGTGSMPTYESSYWYNNYYGHTPWYISRNALKEMILSEGITNISQYLCYGCLNLESITIPDTVTDIGSYAFYNCGKLKSVTIPNGVTTIGSRILYGATSLESLTIPFIGEIQSSETSLKSYVFYNKIPETLKTINITNETAIANNAFVGSKAETITLNEGITTIGVSAFANCTELKEIAIPDSVDNIQDSAFYNCSSMKTVNLGNNANMTIDYDVFNGCNSVESFTIGNSNVNYCSDANGVLYNKNKTGLIRYPAASSMTEYTIAPTTAYINEFAFEKSYNLKKVNFPENMMSVGAYAFRNCTALEEVNIPDGANTICHFAFSGCSSVKKVTLPESLIILGRSAFGDCVNLSEIIINCANLEDANSAPFLNCGTNTTGTKVVFTDKVERIPSYIFGSYYNYYDGNNVTEITIGKNVSYVGESAFVNTMNLNLLNFNATDCWFSSPVFSQYSLDTVNIGNNVERIPEYFVNGCDGLTDITIPESVTEIGKYAFADCDYLENVIFLGKNKVDIGVHIFDYSPKATICCKENSFMHSYADTNVIRYCIIDEANNPDYEIKNEVLISYKGDAESLYLNSVNRIGFGAFSGNWSLRHVELSNTIDRIYDMAFSDCYLLDTVVIPKSVTSIGENAFDGCDDLIIYCYADSYAETYAKEHGIKIEYITFGLTKNKVEIYSNEKMKLGTAYNINLVGKEEVVWTSDNESVVKVAQNGQITAVGEGVATITAKTESGLKAECSVKVNAGKRPDAEGVVPSALTINYKGATKLEPDVKFVGDAGYTVEYSSSNESVATVDKDGNITTIGRGEAEITVTVTDEYGNVVEDTCKVTVSYAWWQWLIIIFLFGWIWY